MSEEALVDVEVNTIAGTASVGAKATPQKPLPSFKRKQLEDEYTPRSRHVDKRGANSAFLASAGKTDRMSDALPTDAATIATDSEDVFSVTEKPSFDGTGSVGSILSQPDFSASVRQAAGKDAPGTGSEENEEDPEVEYYKSDEDRVVATPGSTTSHAGSSLDALSDDKTPLPTHRSEKEPFTRQGSPSRTPRLRDFQIPLTTPRSIVESALRGQPAPTNPNMPKDHTTNTPRFTNADLLSFQTPAPRRQTDPQSQLRRFTNDQGEEMLLDITPRVYSPHSIPIYTLRDLDQIKAEFESVRHELESKIASLHEELATSVSNANHHKALAAQGESLHAEYSKKHVRKVTALKTDWERKTAAKVEGKDEVIKEREERIRVLEDALQLEREEKKEVIQMAEAVLALQQEG